MLKSDRKKLLEFAKASNLDFDCLSRLVCGQTYANGDLALFIAHRTSTDKKIWMAGGTAVDRMMAIRVWHERREMGFAFNRSRQCKIVSF